ncbi:MAG TPA: LptF/LptG family permease [Myxococcota bacterium]|nr:LptF/LptG family permease [Myxococcota bacterium]
MVAPRLLWRYMFRDILLHALLGMFAIMLLLVVTNLLRFMEDLAAAGVGLEALGQLVAAILPAYASYALPTALLFGILLSFGRMSADGEIVAMRASGISASRFLPPALALGVIAAATATYMLFVVQPHAATRIRTLLREIAGSTTVIEPGRFLEFGDRLLFVHALGDKNCPLEGVLIGSAPEGARSFYSAAHCGTVDNDKDAHTLSFVLHDGTVHFRDPDPARYRRIKFETMKTAIDISDYTDPKPTTSQLTFAQLMAANSLPADDAEVKRLNGRYGTALKCQIQRRLSFPFASLVLALIAVPLGIRPMRSGRSAGALTAIAVMALYWLMFSLGDMAASRGVAPAWLGLWAPNAIALGIGIYFMRRIGQSDD